MIFKRGNIYYAFQVTIGKTHDVKAPQIRALVDDLEIGTDGGELRLFYAVHEGVFDDFVTNPVISTSPAGISIYHLSIVQGL